MRILTILEGYIYIVLQVLKLRFWLPIIPYDVFSPPPPLISGMVELPPLPHLSSSNISDLLIEFDSVRFKEFDSVRIIQ
ncbi:hypothetical protein KFK09_008303 [Dendrobium nobile]|uniref:Uncharacterized protein n=1 Tax=Dendrobium nobile TaxID=94219 RepID=A0A8T3BKS8_DENNO|nr:hypothetical protein KFK09_008303 [Dendrobium nobile]